jgi:hypothetical protein
MSEHVKTGKEIYTEINEYSDFCGEHELNDIKFVSVVDLRKWMSSQPCCRTIENLESWLSGVEK